MQEGFESWTQSGARISGGLGLGLGLRKPYRLDWRLGSGLRRSEICKLPLEGLEDLLDLSLLVSYDWAYCPHAWSDSGRLESW